MDKASTIPHLFYIRSTPLYRDCEAQIQCIVMKHKISRLQSLVTVALCVIMAMAFTSCGDDDEPALSPPNAKGVTLDVDSDSSLSKKDVNLWINEWSVRAYSTESEINLNVYGAGRNYYSLDMDVVYEFIGEKYGGIDVDENTDFSNFHPSPEPMIRYIKSNKSKYRYICNWSGTLVLFNRTANVNYDIR